MTKGLEGKKIAILVDDGFEQSELLEPRKALIGAGATAPVVSPVEGRKVKGWKSGDWGEEVEVNVALAQARPEDFDALLLPGGVINPDKLRMRPAAVQFVRAFFDAKKPVAAICHGPWTLINAGVVKGRKMTSWPSVKIDLENAGAQWVDQEAVVDHDLVTSRKPEDIPAFNRAMLEVFEKALHKQRAA